MIDGTKTDQARVDLRAMLEPFRPDLAAADCGVPVAPAQLPSPFDALLAHEEHMTVTLERFYGGPVALEVLLERSAGDAYARQIVLREPRQQRVVELGMVRLRLDVLPQPVRDEVLRKQTPLGTILERSELGREVRPLWFYALAEGLLLEYFGPEAGGPLFGRVGAIFCDGQRAIDVLEIVADRRER